MIGSKYIIVIFFTTYSNLFKKLCNLQKIADSAECILRIAYLYFSFIIGILSYQCLHHCYTSSPNVWLATHTGFTLFTGKTKLQTYAYSCIHNCNCKKIISNNFCSGIICKSSIRVAIHSYAHCTGALTGVWNRLEPIMLLKLPIMLLSNAPFFPQLCGISHLITAIWIHFKELRALYLITST